MSKRKLDFEISSKRYKELCGFCEQYDEWVKKVGEPLYIHGINYDSDPKPSNHGTSDVTANEAIKKLKYKKNIALIEKCAKMASNDWWEYIIRSACYEESWEYLNGTKNLYLSRSSFYERRRYFFFLLDIEKNKE